MPEDFMVLGEQPPEEIARKLREIGDDSAAEIYESGMLESTAEAKEGAPRLWLNIQHQYGFIPPFDSGKGRYQKIISASTMEPDNNLRNQRINVRLSWLRVEEYPRSFFSFGNISHTILFNFEARNQVEGEAEAVAFNQTYEARDQQDVADLNSPIFIGLKVGENGVQFACKTVNVGNADDEKLVKAITSEATSNGLQLLETVQPALTPFVGLAKQLCISLANRTKNVEVQKFRLGLDFDKDVPGARIAVGSYVVAQVPSSNTIKWSEWSYDIETNSIVYTNLAEGEEASVLPYNTVVFRVSKFTSNS